MISTGTNYLCRNIGCPVGQIHTEEVAAEERELLVDRGVIKSVLFLLTISLNLVIRLEG